MIKWYHVKNLVFCKPHLSVCLLSSTVGLDTPIAVSWFWQGCGLDLDASVSRRNSASAQSHLGWNFKRLGLASASRLDVLVLASVLTPKALFLANLGLGSKHLGLVGKHFSITYIKLCLNMPLCFSLSIRLPSLLFRTKSVLGIMWMWDVTPRSRGRLETQ